MIKVLDIHWNFRSNQVTIFCRTKDRTLFDIKMFAKTPRGIDNFLSRNFGLQINETFENGKDRRYTVKPKK